MRYDTGYLATLSLLSPDFCVNLLKHDHALVGLQLSNTYFSFYR